MNIFIRKNTVSTQLSDVMYFTSDFLYEWSCDTENTDHRNMTPSAPKPRLYRLYFKASYLKPVNALFLSIAIPECIVTKSTE